MEPIYTSSFLGIPLPSEYHPDFAAVLTQLKAIDSNLDTVNPNTPHITVQFLDRQTQQNLEAIAETVRPHLPLLNGLRITVRGMGLFNPKSPRVVFLAVEHPSALTDFYRLISKELTPFLSKTDTARFHPHLTLARLRTKSARETFSRSRQEIEDLLRPITWSFLISEVILYGVDTAHSSLGQQKLIRIELA